MCRTEGDRKSERTSLPTWTRQRRLRIPLYAAAQVVLIGTNLPRDGVAARENNLRPSAVEQDEERVEEMLVLL
jgi:hypothetical protein